MTFVALPAARIVALRVRCRHLYRLVAKETLRGALERGQALTPDLVATLANVERPDADLRRSVISITVAIAFVAFVFAVGEDDA